MVLSGAEAVPLSWSHLGGTPVLRPDRDTPSPRKGPGPEIGISPPLLPLEHLPPGKDQAPEAGVPPGKGPGTRFWGTIVNGLTGVKT